MSGKYGAMPTIVDNVRFASKAEAARYRELKVLARAGKIRDLELQPRYQLVVNGVSIGRYTGDFRYRDHTGAVVVEDCKGFRTRDYVLRKKLMKALHGVEITETSA